MEHFIPHKGDRDLKFDWNNLFYACVHCNSTKGDRFDNILNCTNPEHDVENWMKYEMILPQKKVKITALKNNELADNTAQLLLDAYNGTTKHNRLESRNIRETLFDETEVFQIALGRYDAEDVKDDEKRISLKKIKDHLSKSSHFTAFKRWIIKNNPSHMRKFGQYFD